MLAREKCQEKILLLPYLLQKVKLLHGFESSKQPYLFSNNRFQIVEVKVTKVPGQDPCSSEEDLRP